MKTTNKKEKITTKTTNKKKTPKKIIYDFFVLDRSGSMQRIKDSTITGVNEYLNTARNDAKKTKIKTYFSLLTFDNEFDVVYDYVDILKVENLTDKDFIPRNNTALRDATGRAITSLQNKLKGKENDENIDVTITIFTDGYENASTEYTHETIAELIKKVQDEYKWTVVYIGAGNKQKVLSIAKGMNINITNTSSYTANSEDMKNMMHTNSISRSTKTMNFAADIKSTVGYFVDPTTKV